MLNDYYSTLHFYICLCLMFIDIISIHCRDGRGDFHLHRVQQILVCSTNATLPFSPMFMAMVRLQDLANAK